MNEAWPKIPPGEFAFDYLSEEWTAAYFKFYHDHKKPEAKQARDKAFHNGLPATRLHPLEETLKVENHWSERFDELEKRLVDSTQEKQPKILKEYLKVKISLDRARQDLGKIVAEGLRERPSSFHGDLKKVISNNGVKRPSKSLLFSEGLESAKQNDPQNLHAVIVETYDQILKEWFGRGGSLRKLRPTMGMVTYEKLLEKVIALRERLLPGVTTQRADNVEAAMKKLGYGALPRRKQKPS